MASSSTPPPTDLPDHRADAETARGPGRGTVLLMSVAVGLCVAANYYAQPLLDTIARDLQLSSASASLVVTGAQVARADPLAPRHPLRRGQRVRTGQQHDLADRDRLTRTGDRDGHRPAPAHVPRVVRLEVVRRRVRALRLHADVRPHRVRRLGV